MNFIFGEIKAINSVVTNLTSTLLPRTLFKEPLNIVNCNLGYLSSKTQKKKIRHFYQKMYFRILKNGLTILGLRNSSSPSTYGYESLSSTTTEGPSPSSGSEISSEHVVWCTLLGLLLALLVKKGLTILDKKPENSSCQNDNNKKFK